MARRMIDVHSHVYLPRYLDVLRSRRTVPKLLSSPTRLLILWGIEAPPWTALIITTWRQN